ncbi:MAG: uncharacterized protein K0R38_4375 [Polyangiaceae bacterium]|nr:uncharacterized protein [Polyangiaceae bacterium]
MAACSSSERDFAAPTFASGSGGDVGAPGASGQPPTEVGSGGAAGEATLGGEGASAGVASAAPCEDSPCLNGGSCEHSGTVFTCDCAEGFEGERCQQNVDDCSPNPCANAGMCRDGVASFTCECASGFEGDQCDVRLFEPLPLLENATGCRLEALSGNGGVAVGTCWDAEGEKAFWWKPSMGTKPLQSDGAVSEALAVSRDGTVVVGRVQDPGQPSVGQRWLNGQRSQSYSGFVYDDEQRPARATAVADDGLTLFGSSESSNGSPRGIRWDPSGPVLLGSAGGEIYALAASGDGKVVAGYSYDPSAAIRWTLASGWIRLPTSGAEEGRGRGISRDGNVVVGAVGPQAARWIGTNLPELLDILGSGESANEDGSVIVGNSGPAAMVWSQTEGPRLVADVLFELSPGAASEWTLTSADAVSADGKTIGGNGTLDGVERAWLARLP